MLGFTSARGARSAGLGVVLLAAMLMLAVGTSVADREGGRGSERGDREYRGGGRGHDGGRGYRGGVGRGYGTWGGGGHAYDRGGRGYGTWGGGGRAYDRGGRGYGTWSGGGRSYYGGERHFARVRYYQDSGDFCGPYVYRQVRPRTHFSLGIGLGVPYYCPPAYRDYVEPYPVEVRDETLDRTPVETGSGTSIDVTNEPPSGCYYYDRFCDRRFSNLDDYTDHVESQDHAKTIDIVQKDTGESIRTLEFVGGYWSVQQ